jgi:hypothetical protein
MKKKAVNNTGISYCRKKIVGLCTISLLILLAGCKKEDSAAGYVDKSPQIISTINGTTYQIEQCKEEDFTKEEIESTDGFWDENTEGDPDVLGKLVAVDKNGQRNVLDRLVYYKDGTCNVISTDNRLIYIGYPQIESLNYKGRVYVSISYDGASRDAGEAKDTPNILNMQYIDGYVYYSQDNGSAVYRADEDLQKVYMIGEVPGTFITVADKSIFYWNNSESDEKQGIYSQTLSGAEKDVFVQDVGIENLSGTVSILERNQTDSTVSIKGELKNSDEKTEEFLLEIPFSS